MLNLFRFLQKYHVMLLFLFLETIAILMLSKSHTYHRAAVVNISSQFTGDIFETKSQFTSYFSLGSVNIKLAGENAQLREQISRLEALVDSTSRHNSNIPFSHIPARAVSNTVHFRNNYILINKGSIDGVKPDMGIISPEGVAGIITGVTDHYSTALSLLHRHARISVMFRKSGQLANLTWEGKDFRFGLVEDIPSHLKIFEGDTVVTSGHSLIFPEGLMVGIITEYIEPPGSSLNKAILHFSTDFNSLRQVYVVSNNHQYEIDSLMKTNQHE